MRLACFALLLAACNADALGIGDKYIDPGPVNGGCSGNHDPASCAADGNCYWDGCPTCTGWTSDSGCWAKNGPVHSSFCDQQPACTFDCTQIVQPEICKATPQCTLLDELCGTSCAPAGTPQPGGGPVGCPAFCWFAQDEASCEASTFPGGCHATFLDPDQFDCSISSCKLTFATCQPGPPRCAGPEPASTTCPPAPTCTDGFLPERDDSGCVQDCIRVDKCGA